MNYQYLLLLSPVAMGIVLIITAHRITRYDRPS